MSQVVSSTLRLGVPGGPVVAGLVVLAFIVVVVLGVRQAARMPVPRRRAAVIGLRLLTAALALAYALQPQWIEQRVQKVQGRLAVLVDASRSMSVRDVTPSRAQRALEFVQRLRKQSSAPLDLYAFGASAHALKLEDLDAQKLSREDETRIGRAVTEVVKELGDELGAVVLISDGADGSATTLPGELKALGVRVHTVSVGGERELRDDAIVSVKADAVAFLRQAAEVEVTVRSSSGRDRPLVVSLRKDGQLVAEATATLDSSGQGKVVLPFTASRLGRAVYTLSLPLEEGDAVPENNERAFLVHVSRDKTRVLLLCGAPTWDTRFLRAFLKADPAIDLITFFILRTGSDLQMASQEELSLIPFPTEELFREHLDSFDLVIFQDFNYGPYQVGAYLSRIRDYVLKGGAFAMVGGVRSFGPGGYEHTPIAEILPVHMAPLAAATSDAEFQPELVAANARHPIVELVPDPEQNRKSWSELAPLLGANKLVGARESAQVLLTHPHERDAQGQPMPVLTVGAAGQGRVLALGADSSYRFSITTAGRRGDASAYDRFWDRALRWLVRDPRLEPARIETDRERYGPAATIEAKLRARDERYQPLRERDLGLQIFDASGALEGQTRVHSDADGNASASLAVPAQPGPYRIVLRDPQNDVVLAEEGFLVEAGGEELADPRARPDVLAAIAEATSGKHFAESDKPSLDAFDRTRSRALGAAVVAPFASAWFFALLLGAFGLEWAARRAWGQR